MCHAAMRSIIIGQPSALIPHVLSCYHSHQHLSLLDIQELADKGRLHTSDDDIVIFVFNPTPPPTPDEPCSVEQAACLQNDEPICM